MQYPFLTLLLATEKKKLWQLSELDWNLTGIESTIGLRHHNMNVYKVLWSLVTQSVVRGLAALASPPHLGAC